MSEFVGSAKCPHCQHKIQVKYHAEIIAIGPLHHPALNAFREAAGKLGMEWADNELKSAVKLENWLRKSRRYYPTTWEHQAICEGFDPNYEAFSFAAMVGILEFGKLKAFLPHAQKLAPVAGVEDAKSGLQGWVRSRWGYIPQDVPFVALRMRWMGEFGKLVQ